MPEITVEICNQLGLHARAAARLVKTASSFSSDVRIGNGERQVNAKSIMGVMMLAAAKGTSVTLEATGEDADEALTALTDLINNRFGEAQ
ncbi:MAG: HPr family phosphocarrier protein [Pseudomonadota bacterium]|mgnify:CR=1 FL=1